MVFECNRVVKIITFLMEKNGTNLFVNSDLEELTKKIKEKEDEFILEDIILYFMNIAFLEQSSD